MRGLTVLTVVLVFASSALFVGTTSAQTSSGSGSATASPQPMPPEDGNVSDQEPVQDGWVQGRVTDQDGNPVTGAFVSYYSYNSPCCYAYEGDMAKSARPSYYGGGNQTTTDADGRFGMGVYSGEGSVAASKDGYTQRSLAITVPADGVAQADLELQKVPDRTSHISGKLVDAKTGKGLANAYINIQNPQYGTNECSQPESSSSASGSGSASSPSGSDASSSPGIAVGEPVPGGYYDPGCTITLHPDGSFDGMVRPGYSILSVWVDSYSACAQSGFAQSCGPEYYSLSESRVLPADGPSTFDLRLRSRPAPDAVVSGYVVDAETGKAIAGASISFNNQDTYGYGSATTDQDGSYSLSLRSGYHSVSVWAPGHLRWEGVLLVAKGDSPFDAKVQPGEESYGYCCPGPYYGGVAYDDAAVKSSSSESLAATSTAAAPNAAGASESTQQVERYHDLGGGLGPYDAAKRSDQLEEPSNGAPGLGLVALLAVVGAVAILRRRLA